MDKSTTIEPDQLMVFWKKGWPAYILNRQDDYPAILDLARKSAEVSGEDTCSDHGRNRIMLAMTAIAVFCDATEPYCKRNLHFINKAFQTIIHEMQYAKRSDKLQKQIDVFNDYYDRDKKKVQENIRLMEEGRLASLKWYNENWTDKDQIEYDAWKANGFKIPNLKANR